MRLFVQNASEMVVVVLDVGDTLDDLAHKCRQRFDIVSPVSFRLDVHGNPIVRDVTEIAEGDRLIVHTVHDDRKRQRTAGAKLSARDASNQLRDRHDLFRSFAGSEDGNAIVRALLAAREDITREELSVPTDVVLAKEVSMRASIVATTPVLSRWSVAGFYSASEETPFLCAATTYLRTPILVMDVDAGNTYTFMRRYHRGATEVVSWEDVLRETPGSLLLQRKNGTFAPFCRMVRPTTREQALEMHSRGFGACHDRSRYVTAAVKAGILPKAVRCRPRDGTHVPFIYAHMNLNGIARQTLNLLDLTFREECERRERQGELAPGACIPFEDNNAQASGILVRKDAIPLRNAWSHSLPTRELDIRRDIRATEAMTRRVA